MSTIGSFSPLGLVPLINIPLIFQKYPLLNNCTFQEKGMNRIFKILKKKNKFCAYFLLRLSSSQVFSNKVSSTLKIHERPLTKGFLLTSCRSRLQLWVGYFICFKFISVRLFDNFNECPSSMKEINTLTSQGMCVLLFDVFNGCCLVQLNK